MIYDKSITINTNLSLDNSKEKLKQLTFPYSKASKYKCDFIGRISDDSFDITLNLSGPGEPIRTKVVGCFKSNNEGTIVYAKLKPSPVTLFFQIIYSCLCILFFIIFLLYNPSTILLPILMFCFGNLVMLIFIRSNFNTTENILQKAYCNKCEIRA